MNDHSLFDIIFFSIGFAIGGLATYIWFIADNRKLRKQVKKWEQKYQESQEDWYRRFEQFEQQENEQHGQNY